MLLKLTTGFHELSVKNIPLTFVWSTEPGSILFRLMMVMEMKVMMVVMVMVMDDRLMESQTLGKKMGEFWAPGAEI